MSNLKCVNTGLMITCALGVLLSSYSYLVELNLEENENYTAMCDISEHMSCTKAFGSKYGKGFGIIGSVLGEEHFLNQPNSLGGIFFYMFLAALSTMNVKGITKLLVSLCVISNLLSLYLAYILTFILHDFCVVCISTYVVNAVNLFLSIKKLKSFERFKTD